MVLEVSECSLAACAAFYYTIFSLSLLCKNDKRVIYLLLFTFLTIFYKKENLFQNNFQEVFSRYV